jgi:ribulose-phosphate 3-epimerase
MPRALPLTPPIVAPSILSADFSRLGADIAIADPDRDWVHCDVMDNHFVPNLTFGPLLVRAARRLTAGFLDVHLMVERPESLAQAFRDAGADQITIHLEACREPGVPLERFDPGRVSASRVVETLERVRATGARVGLSIKPGTPLDAATPFLDSLDVLLVMTVEPGFGGQEFMEDQLPKVAAAAAWKSSHGARFLIEVDGGMNPETARQARIQGAEVFVAGNAIFGQTDPVVALAAIRKAVSR